MKLTAPLRAALRVVLDAIAPRECAACGAPSDDGLCEECRALVEPAPPATLDGIPLVAGGLYRAPLDRVLWQFKYEGRPDLAPALAGLLLPALDELRLGSATCFVPVPLHKKRLSERGYDQACLLARELASEWRSSWSPRMLCRGLYTGQQARLGREEREANVRGAFTVPLLGRVRGLSVVLVDDVVTTGATARACIAALSRADAKVAAVACVAVRAPKSAGSQGPALRDC